MTADRLIRFYPSAWRDRYGAEFVETVGSAPLSLQQVIDITMGAIDAWLSSDVRRSTTGVAAGASPGRGRTMITMPKVLCTSSKVRMTTRDGLISAAVMLTSSFAMIAVGVMTRRSGNLAIGEALTSLAFPVSMLASMPFGIMKGQPWRAQALVLSVTFLILIGAGYLSTRI